MAKSKTKKLTDQLQDWLFKTALDAKDNGSLKDGTCYVFNLFCGASVVLCWSEGDEFEYESDNPFMKASKVRTVCGKDTMMAYCLEVSLRETEPLSSWGNSPGDWNYWNEDGSCSLSQSDIDDKMLKMANYLMSQIVESFKI